MHWLTAGAEAASAVAKGLGAGGAAEDEAVGLVRHEVLSGLSDRARADAIVPRIVALASLVAVNPWVGEDVTDRPAVADGILAGLGAVVTAGGVVAGATSGPRVAAGRIDLTAVGVRAGSLKTRGADVGNDANLSARATGGPVAA